MTALSGNGALLAAWFGGGNAPEVFRQIRRIECLHIHLHEGEKRAPEIRQVAAAAVDDRACGHNDAAMVADDLDGLLHTSATGDDVFGDEKPFTGVDLKSSAKNKSTVAVFFNEDVFFSEMAGDFLTHDDAAHGG